MRVVNGIKMFSSKEVAELLDITDRTLSKLRKEGLIRSVTLGRGSYTSEQSLTDYLNGMTLPKPKTEKAEQQIKVNK